MQKTKLFRRDFSLVVIGQIISLFGNAILRFALPLHLFNLTASPALFGAVSACSFIPMVLLSPVGGIVADRVNKRNIMVALDFVTAGLILAFTLLLGRVDFVGLVVVTLMLLYGISGTYQPAVQASLPALVEQGNLVAANAVINQVNSLAALVGPVCGGILYGFTGINTILWLSILCFFLSAVMEIFIHIPFEKRESASGVFATVRGDLVESFHFIRCERPSIAKAGALVAFFNMAFSALLIVGIPILILQSLNFSAELGSALCGYTQGAMALGGLLGGGLASVFSNRLHLERVHLFLLGAAVCLVPMGLSLAVSMPSLVSYGVVTLCAFVMMALASLFSIPLLTYLQQVTPPHLIGKVISVVMAVATCAQPIGQAIYGKLFEVLAGAPQLILFGAAVLTFLVVIPAGRIFAEMSRESVQ